MHKLLKNNKQVYGSVAAVNFNQAWILHLKVCNSCFSLMFGYAVYKKNAFKLFAALSADDSQAVGRAVCSQYEFLVGAGGNKSNSKNKGRTKQNTKRERL